MTKETMEMAEGQDNTGWQAPQRCSSRQLRRTQVCHIQLQSACSSIHQTPDEWLLSERDCWSTLPLTAAEERHLRYRAGWRATEAPAQELGLAGDAGRRTALKLATPVWGYPASLPLGSFPP